MPTYKGVEVWIEDSEHRKLNHQEVTFNLVDADDRTVTVKTQMLRDELYTVHCLSPTSVFCDVFVTTASRVRRCAARFYLDKSLAISENVSGSSTDHTTEQFKDQGLRTSKRQFQHGKLGTVEVEVRRIGEIIKGEPREEECQVDEDGGVEFIMIDEPDQRPWLTFRFDIRVKGLLAVPGPAERVRKRAPRTTNQSHAMGTGPSNETSREIGHDSRHNLKKRPREHDSHDGSSNVCRDPSPTDTNLNRLQQEYEKEEAEEQRLLLKLQERLHTKKARNKELRRLLRETA